MARGRQKQESETQYVPNFDEWNISFFSQLLQHGFLFLVHISKSAINKENSDDIFFFPESLARHCDKMFTYYQNSLKIFHCGTLSCILSGTMRCILCGTMSDTEVKGTLKQNNNIPAFLHSRPTHRRTY